MYHCKGFAEIMQRRNGPFRRWSKASPKRMPGTPSFKGVSMIMLCRLQVWLYFQGQIWQWETPASLAGTWLQLRLFLSPIAWSILWNMGFQELNLISRRVGKMFDVIPHCRWSDEGGQACNGWHLICHQYTTGLEHSVESDQHHQSPIIGEALDRLSVLRVGNQCQTPGRWFCGLWQW